MTSRTFSIWTCLLSLLPALAGAAGPRRAADLNEMAPAQGLSSVPGWLTRIGSRVVLAAGTHAEGYELWATDGTTAGTDLLRDFCPGPCGAVSPIAAGDDLAFYLADVGNFVQELVVTDGTSAGTQVLTRPGQVFGFDELGAWLPEAHKLIFAPRGPGGREPWVSDGTAAGTFALGNFSNDRQARIGAIAAGRRLAYLLGNSGDPLGWSLLVSDGTPAGTRLLRRLSDPGGEARLAVVGDRALAAALDAEGGERLWVSDGTPAGTLRLDELVPALAPYPYQSVVFAGQEYAVVLGLRSQGSQTLWRTDGTAAGTFQLLANGGGFEDLAAAVEAGPARPRYFFLWTTSATGQELWSTDGTALGTALVRDGCPGTCSSVVRTLGWAGSRFVFVTGPGAPTQIWATDGTTAGTQALIAPCERSCDLGVAGEVGGRLVFRLGTRLWRTDGTPAGTTEISPLEVQTVVPGVVDAAGELIFSARIAGGPAAGHELWKTSASAGDLALVRNIGRDDLRPLQVFSAVPFGAGLLLTSRGAAEWALWHFGGNPAVATAVLSGSNEQSGPLSRPLVLGQRAIVASQTGFDGAGVWSTDGTAAGTHHLADLNNGLQYCGMESLGGRAYFRDGEFVPDLWTSDGTPAGTHLIAAGLGPAHCTGKAPIAFAGNLYFLGVDGDLYRSDGSAAGTTKHFDLPPSQVRQGFLTALPNQLLLASEGATSGTGAFWRTDGTTTTEVAGPAIFTEVLYQRAVLGNQLYFANSDAAAGVELWRTDGTAAGTALVKDIYPGDFGSGAPDSLTAVGNRLFFVAEDGSHGRELWVSDGSEAGTHLVADLLPGWLSSFPRELAAVGERVVFQASDGIHGVELWVSDGTAGGTQMVADLAPGPRSSNPFAMNVVGDELYFVADDGSGSQALWALPLTSLVSCDEARDLCLRDGRVRVRVRWREARSGQEGEGTPVPFSDRTGFFWFFNADNLELVVKVLDGTAVNGHLWTFYGALSDVEYWLEVTDLATGTAKTYHNPQGEICGVGDTFSLPVPAFFTEASSFVFPGAGKPDAQPAAAATSCTSTADTLCLLGRFEVSVDWRDQRTGTTGRGSAVAGTEKSGFFSFFNSANLELVVKMLDGTPINGNFWFFFGALSDVEYTIHVRDTSTGSERSYLNPPGEICGQAHVDAFESG